MRRKIDKERKRREDKITARMYEKVIWDHAIDNQPKNNYYMGKSVHKYTHIS